MIPSLSKLYYTKERKKTYKNAVNKNKIIRKYKIEIYKLIYEQIIKVYPFYNYSRF